MIAQSIPFLYVVYYLCLVSMSFSHVLHPCRRQRIERMRVNREKDKLNMGWDRKIKTDRWGRGSKLGWDEMGWGCCCLSGLSLIHISYSLIHSAWNEWGAGKWGGGGQPPGAAEGARTDVRALKDGGMLISQSLTSLNLDSFSTFNELL